VHALVPEGGAELVEHVELLLEVLKVELVVFLNPAMARSEATSRRLLGMWVGGMCEGEERSDELNVL